MRFTVKTLQPWLLTVEGINAGCKHTATTETTMGEIVHICCIDCDATKVVRKTEIAEK